MSTIEEIQTAISELSIEELSEFRAWFLEFEAKAWDQEFEQDVAAGRLDALAEEALRDLREGRVRFPNGEVRLAELHWYEAHGIGRRKMKVKRALD